MHFSPRQGVTRARILTSAEIKHAIRCAELTRDPERNTLLILITHACGLLGHESVEYTYPYIEPADDAIRHAFEVAL